MVELTFDIRGHLYPTEKIKMTLEDFKKTFVDSFDLDSTRHWLFERYSLYVEDFKHLITMGFTQWIDGSFVTNKTNPEDIDFVTLLDFEIFELKNDAIQKQFENQASIDRYGLDAYLVKVYPRNHRFFNRTHSDLLYWEHWFGKSKPNRAGKRFSKGYIELIF